MAYRAFGRFWQAHTPATIRRLLRPHHPFLAIARNGADLVLDRVAVDLDATVRQEGLQPVPVIVDIGELLAKPGLDRDPAALSLQPFAKAATSGAVRV